MPVDAPRETRVSESDTYITKMNNIWIYTNTNYLGETTDTTDVAKPDEENHYYAPAKWENGLKGPKHLKFPLADEYTLSEKTQLDQITVSDITRELKGDGSHSKPQAAHT